MATETGFTSIIVDYIRISRTKVFRLSNIPTNIYTDIYMLVGVYMNVCMCAIGRRQMRAAITFVAELIALHL